MGTLEVVRKFIESNWIIEKSVKEVLERLPLRFRYGISYGPTFRMWLAFLNESEKWDRDRVESYRTEQLRNLLIHAGKNVPYYRKVFAELAFIPEKLQSRDDLRTLPFLDKEILRDRIGEFLADNIPKGKLFRKNTSGSTGIPLAVYSDKEAEEKHWATVIYAWSRAGYTASSKMATFWGIVPKWKRYGRQLILSRFHFDRGSLSVFAEKIRVFEPDFVLGLPSVLYLFARFMGDTGLRPFEGIRACIAESESLYPWQKELIEEQFGARTYSTYGMVEKALYAWGCMSSPNYHLCSRYGIAETVELGDGLSGLVGTGFINYANPLIRYRTADIGTVNTQGCPGCGSANESLDLTEGRVGDLLIDSDGGALSPMRVGVNSTVFDNVRIFQFFQDTPGKVVLRIVRKPSFSGKDRERIRKRIIGDLGLTGKEKLMAIEIEFADDLPPCDSGKFRMVRQELNVRDFIERERGVSRP